MCSLTTPEEYSSGIDQPPKSANFAPSATCRSCSGDVSGELWASGSVPSMFGTYRDYPAPVSTYTLRAANPAKTRCDAVVVGVVQGKGSGDGLSIAPGGEEVAKEYGRALRPLLASLGVTGKPGEVTKVPTGKRLSSPLLVLVGLGKLGKGEAPSTNAVRRAAGAASRVVTNTASVAIALPADSVELVRAVTEGFLLGGYTYTAYKKKADDDSTKVPGDVVVLCPSARKKEFGLAFEEAQIVVGGGRDDAQLGQHAARRLHAAGLRRRGRGRREGGLEGPRTQGVGPGARREAAPRARLRRHPRRRDGLRRRRRGWSSCRTPRASRSPTSRWSARASPSTPAG